MADETIEQAVHEYFKTLTAYTPCFTTFEGSLYEMELTRAAVHSFATHVSKLKPEVKGSGNKVLERILQFKPNANMDTKKYLYRLATSYMVDNTAFVAPLTDMYGEINGFYPLPACKCMLTDYKGKKYIRYQISGGKYAAIELERCGILNQYQYRNELFGESNACLRPTMELINTHNQGIIEGVKSSAMIRFMAKLAGTFKPSDIKKERERFVEENLSTDNNGGVMVYDSKYSEVKQIESKPFVVNSSQMASIKENVFNYFGTNEHILQNNFTSDEWNAYYEGKIEPFAVEMSLVHTNLVFNMREIAYGNEIIFTANRLQYLTNTEKLNTVTQLFDRGFITHNQGLEIFNMSPVEGGDKRYIRKEYALTENFKDFAESEEIGNADSGGQTVPSDAGNAGSDGGQAD